MRNNIFNIVLMLLLLVGGNSMAQNYMSVPYSLDWEESEAAEINNWVINPGSTAAYKEQWVVGTAVHSAGRRALYISSDGLNAEYTVAKNVQYAYRDVMLPAGKYIFSFDWKIQGSTKSTLSAGYALASQLTAMTGSNTSATIPTAISNKINAQMRQMFGQESWENTAFQIQSNGTDPTRVFFVWSNSEADTLACGMGACIDNIQITSTACPRPDNLSSETRSCDEVLFHWTGASADYEVQFRQVGTDIWYTCYDVTATGNTGLAVCTGMNEGSYDFRVRGICTQDTSAWNYLTNTVVYCEELHCINFTDLNGPNVVCYYGTTSSSYTTSKQNAYASRGVIDYGPEDMRSRHTVNTDPTATDPRTGGNLPLIPKGQKFSVRLGNWDTNNGAEAISYTITADSSMAIILLQYAVVLEDPDGHGEDSPRFLLEVLGENGELLDATCGARNFLPQPDWADYHPSGGYGVVRYKPWTTVGLNLNELGVQDGDQITVRLTTYDCFWSAHFGYAYFCLDCSSPTIQTHSCAKDDKSTGMELKAPAGFNYQWLDNRHNPIPGETNPIFYPMDTATYYCRLTSTENAACNFELASQCVPRLPIPEYTLNYEPKDCKNIVRVSNTSYPCVVLNKSVIEVRDQKCDRYTWEYWGDNFPVQTSSRDSLKVTLPQDGGTFYFRLTAELEGGCDSVMTKQITIPKIGNSELHEEAALCEKSGVWFFDKYIKYEDIHGQDTTIELGGKTAAGCDSLVNMYIYKAPSYSIKLDTAEVYEGGTYEFAGKEYVINESKFMSALLQTEYGCDSMVMQYVKMVPCYNLVYQRWNDVLSVMNEEAQLENKMKPVTCVAFQWMKDHLPIEGETDSYYYEDGGLEDDHVYSVLVTLSNGEQYETCDLHPKKFDGGGVRKVRKVLRDGTLYLEQDNVRVDVLGNKYICK